MRKFQTLMIIRNYKFEKKKKELDPTQEIRWYVERHTTLC